MEKNRKALLIFGISLVIIGIASLVPLYFIPVPDGNREVLFMGIGTVLGWGGSSVAYYFTSDKDR